MYFFTYNNFVSHLIILTCSHYRIHVLIDSYPLNYIYTHLNHPIGLAVCSAPRQLNAIYGSYFKFLVDGMLWSISSLCFANPFSVVMGL